VRFAREQPQLLDNFQVDFVDAPDLEDAPLEDHKTNLHAVFGRILPKKDDSQQALEKLRKSMLLSGLDVDQEFKEEYRVKSFRPRMHAEMLLLEHFWTNELRFFNDDLYVGSSKPSCYCCDLYFRFHSSEITTRPTHGNVWSKWRLPPEAIQTDGRLDWNTKVILKRMTERVRLDLLRQVETELPRRARLNDSTMGVWTAPALGMPAG
jgi:hypothetical protein